MFSPFFKTERFHSCLNLKGKIEEWDLRPDCLYPTLFYATNKPDKAVKLHIDEKKIGTCFIMTVVVGPEKKRKV